VGIVSGGAIVYAVDAGTRSGNLVQHFW
jgi:hypothetical protein